MGGDQQRAQPEPILCYVDRQELYFTTRPLDRQWGDDWNDAPWWCNAGTPYPPYREGEDWRLYRVYWAGPFFSPTDDGGPYVSVETINSGEHPWIVSVRLNMSGAPCVRIMGGLPYSQVARGILEGGGCISPLALWPCAEHYAARSD